MAQAVALTRFPPRRALANPRGSFLLLLLPPPRLLSWPGLGREVLFALALQLAGGRLMLRFADPFLGGQSPLRLGASAALLGRGLALIVVGAGPLGRGASRLDPAAPPRPAAPPWEPSRPLTA